uniref:Tubulin/FtsZ 2-layer sandwich domain-containing protein n=1 Tax=Palpitomonas bilix TaxID=652834 RepID=A0A7S3GDK6_9EUKA
MRSGGVKSTASTSGDGEVQTGSFEHMNSVAAHLLANLTAPMRFDGDLNVDLNEITMNLVPFPKVHFLCSSMSPLHLSTARLRYKDPSKGALTKEIDRAFDSVLSRQSQLFVANPKGSTYLTCAFLARGKGLDISDIARNVSRVSSGMDFPYWNADGFKTGLCRASPLSSPFALLCLANNCCIRTPLRRMTDRFSTLKKRKVFVHHYTKYMDEHCFDEAWAAVDEVVERYAELDKAGSGVAALTSGVSRPSLLT